MNIEMVLSLLKTILTLPGKFFSRSGQERRLFLEALCRLGLSRLAIVILPFRRIAPFLVRKMVETPRKPLYGQIQAARIAWAVKTAARFTPWESKCLAQAMTGKIMLKRRKLPSTLYLGLAKDEAEGLKAHAWLRCGDAILTGGPGHGQFSVVAMFGDSASVRQ